MKIDEQIDESVETELSVDFVEDGKTFFRIIILYITYMYI